MEPILGSESVSVIQTYPDLARNVSQMISSAQYEIYLAPRYYEASIGSKVLAKFAEGVTMHMLDSNACGITFENRLRTASIHDVKNKDLILKMLDTPNLITLVERLDYSFVVVDGKQCCVELVNPANPDNFTCALRVQSEKLANELISVFEAISKSASLTRPVASQTVA